MKRYRIEICGENLLLDLDGDHGKFGFTTTRVIKARTPDEAKRIALIQIHQQLNNGAQVVKSTPDAPRVYAVSIEELKFFQFISKKRCGSFDFVSEEIQPG